MAYIEKCSFNVFVVIDVWHSAHKSICHKVLCQIITGKLEWNRCSSEASTEG